MPSWEDRHPVNDDGTVDIIVKDCALCGMTIPDVGIYTEQHMYKVHGEGKLDERPNP